MTYARVAIAKIRIWKYDNNTQVYSWPQNSSLLHRIFPPTDNSTSPLELDCTGIQLKPPSRDSCTDWVYKCGTTSLQQYLAPELSPITELSLQIRKMIDDIWPAFLVLWSITAILAFYKTNTSHSFIENSFMYLFIHSFKASIINWLDRWCGK